MSFQPYHPHLHMSTVLSAQCSLEVLHSPNIELLVQLLQDHPDYIGFQDKIALLAESGQD